MTPNGEFTSVSGECEEYVVADDKCFLYVLFFMLRDEQEFS